MEVMMQKVLTRLGIDSAEVMPQEPSEMRAIRKELLAGHKITAIKLYRELYGVGLKEAKDAIDAMEGNLRG
jgi:ribosomal protein L7/L12